VLTVAVRADVTGFLPNPPVSNESYTFEMNRWVFDSLVRLDTSLRVTPGLAGRWETPDADTYVFELRPGLRFSDGSPVTAADVAASLEAARQRPWPTGDYLRPIGSVRVLDAARIEIRTARPEPTFLTRLPWAFVLPEAALKQDVVPAIGAGPYRLKSWSPGKEFVLARNPFYWDKAPEFESVRFVVVPHGEARVAMVERAEADVADNVPLEAFQRLEARSDLKLVAASGHRVLFLVVSADRPPFRDPRVREAIDLAVDRAELVERALLGRSQVASQLLPPSVVGHDPERRPTLPDRARARRLLREAGHAAGLALVLHGPNNRYVRDVEVVQEVARQLGEVGVRAETRFHDKLEFLGGAERGSYDFYLLGWASESGDGGDALDTFFNPPSPGTPRPLHSIGLSDPELEALIGAVHAAADVKTRAEALRQAFARIAELRPVIPLVVQTEAVVHSRRLAWDPPLGLALRPGDFRRAPPAEGP
jgi:peptide/nickel transport system substrate-binding protein